MLLWFIVLVIGILQQSWKIVNFMKISPLPPPQKKTGSDFDLGSKTHYQPQVVIVESNPLFFSSELYDA